MDEFNEILNITNRLLGPKGCPWDREQTLKTLRPSVLEETFELIEAIDLDQNEHILEELGDLFFNAIFLCKIAEKENRFKLEAVLKQLAEKLIRRHPHVFGEASVENMEGLRKQWDKIKKTEKGKTHRESALDGIPKDLPALSRSQKSLKKIAKTSFKSFPKGNNRIPDFKNEEELGKLLLEIVAKAQEKGIDSEHALRKELAHLEQDFRLFEKNSEN